jgi:transmembrane sensor
MSLLHSRRDDEPTQIRPAVRWFLRLRDENTVLEAEELREWERFIAEPAQRQELVELKELWQAMQSLGGPGCMPTPAELDADDFDDRLSVSQWMARRATARNARSTSFARRARWFSLAASLVALAIGIVFYAPPWFESSTRGQARVFATSRAEQRTVNLIDGSTVTLGALTDIRTRITAAERTIVLTRGEAWFEVAHDRIRPFRVFAGEGVITAVGTEFNVRRDLDGGVDRVTVTVGAGAVDVEAGTIIPQASVPTNQVIVGRSERKLARLVRGQQITYAPGGEQGEVRGADVEAAGAWKRGRLEYIHQPLSVVVANVNRYSDKPIVLADESIGAIDFSGTVFEGQVGEWLRALQTAFPIMVTETHDRILIQAQTSRTYPQTSKQSSDQTSH